MTDDRLRRQIEFIVEIDKLKSVLRQTTLVDGSRRENSAEHSWHIALMAVVLAEHANTEVNLLHTLKMLLIHDTVEIDAGDTFAYDEVGALDKEEREDRAARRIFGLLPEDQRAEFYTIWLEFEARETPESRLANAMDRMMPVLHNYYNHGGTWRRHDIEITRERVEKRVHPIDDGSHELWTFIEELLDDAVGRGMLTP